MSRLGNRDQELARKMCHELFRKLTFTLLLCLLSYPVFSQEIDSNLNRILKSYDDEELQDRIDSIAKRYEGMPVAMYLDAVVEADASVAVEKYLRLITRFPESEYAATATFKIGQYYFSRGLYVSARKYFLQLIEKYPESSYIDDAMYYAASCLFAIRNYDSCRSELRNFLAHYQRSPLREIAKQDLDEIDSKTNHKADRNKEIQNPSGTFTLQVGAFNQINNALNLRNYLSKLGLPVEVREKHERKDTLYLVWLGSFETKREAQDFGETFKEEHGKPYRIVTRN